MAVRGVTDMLSDTVGNTEAGVKSYVGEGGWKRCLLACSGSQVGFCGSSFASLHNGPLLAPFLPGPS